METQEIPHKKRNSLQRFTKFYVSLLLCCIIFIPSLVFASPFQTKEEHYVYLQLKNPYMTVDGVTMLIDVEKKATPIFIDKWDRVFIPISGVVKNMGVKIKWNAEWKKILITKGSTNTSAVLQIGNPKAEMNEKNIWIDEEKHEITPVIINERAYVTVIFISKLLKTKVEWSPNHEFVTLTWVEP
ncbi:MAG: hypothetical protein KAH01_05155 [Caldisericia bacterium]|nr:hypothetical protein [Caldisericia bacterium]